MNVLVDSCVFISFYDLRDSNHAKAAKDLVNINLDGEIQWITSHILDEVVNVLQKRGFIIQMNDFITKYLEEKIKMFMPANRYQDVAIVNKAIIEIQKQKGSKASFTDLYSKIIVEDNYLPNSKILSYDHHLVKL